MNPYWPLIVGAVAACCWLLGTWVIISVFRTKPRSMKQVAGDNSTQIQTGGDLKQ